MERNVIDLTIEEAGGLIYLADSNFGGIAPSEFHNFFGGRPGLKELTVAGGAMAGTLYQDNGYNIRVLLGDPNDQELDEWTSKIEGKINAVSGRIVLSGVCDPDLESYMKEWPSAENGGSYHLGTFVDVTPGDYFLTIYSYPPNDLGGGWMALSDPSMYRATFGKDAELEFEEPAEYFTRTRPGETPRHWHIEGWEDADFLDFMIHLSPLSGPSPEFVFEGDGSLLWQYRKPEKCPRGIDFAAGD